MRDPVVNQKIETHGEVHRPPNPTANTVWSGVVCKEPVALCTLSCKQWCLDVSWVSCAHVCSDMYGGCILLPSPRGRKQRKSKDVIPRFCMRTSSDIDNLHWEFQWSPGSVQGDPMAGIMQTWYDAYMCVSHGVKFKYVDYGQSCAYV